MVSVLISLLLPRVAGRLLATDPLQMQQLPLFRGPIPGRAGLLLPLEHHDLFRLALAGLLSQLVCPTGQGPELIKTGLLAIETIRCLALVPVPGTITNPGDAPFSTQLACQGLACLVALG